MTNIHSCDSCNRCNNLIAPTQIEEFSYNSDLLSHPSAAVFSVTDRCNLACTYCFVKQNPKTTTLSIAQAVCDYITTNAEKSNKTPTLIFFGGEPLLCFDDIIKPTVINNPHISFGITTNGTLLNEDVVDFFYEHNIEPLLSFDGVQEAQMARHYHSGKQSFNDVLNNIQYLLLRFPNTTMRATVSLCGQSHIYDTYLMAEQLGFQSLVLAPDCISSPLNTVILFQQFELIAKHITKRLLQNTFPVLVSPFIKLYQKIDSDCQPQTGIVRCGLATTSTGVSPEGLIIPCQEHNSDSSKAIGDVFNGIDFNKHLDFLRRYHQQINNLKCPQGRRCPSQVRALCRTDTCPSRLQANSFIKPIGECDFYKIIVPIVRRLHYIFKDSPLQIAKNYFNSNGGDTI